MWTCKPCFACLSFIYDAVTSRTSSVIQWLFSLQKVYEEAAHSFCICYATCRTVTVKTRKHFTKQAHCWVAGKGAVLFPIPNDSLAVVWKRSGLLCLNWRSTGWMVINMRLIERAGDTKFTFTYTRDNVWMQMIATTTHAFNSVMCLKECSLLQYDSITVNSGKWVTFGAHV